MTNKIQWLTKGGFKTVGNDSRLVNRLELHLDNICIWYDGTMRPVRGHTAITCKWKFDGQVYYHV